MLQRTGTMKPLLFAAAALLPILLYAYAEGPDAGVSGVPGEATCSACHSGGGAPAMSRWPFLTARPTLQVSRSISSSQ